MSPARRDSATKAKPPIDVIKQNVPRSRDLKPFGFRSPLIDDSRALWKRPVGPSRGSKPGVGRSEGLELEQVHRDPIGETVEQPAQFRQARRRARAARMNKNQEGRPFAVGSNPFRTGPDERWPTMVARLGMVGQHCPETKTHQRDPGDDQRLVPGPIFRRISQDMSRKENANILDSTLS